MYLIYLFTYIYYSQCANILGVFTIPSISHQSVYQPIWRELSLRGHNVTVVTPDPINDPSLINLTEISARHAYEIWKHVKLQDSMSKNTNIFYNSITMNQFLDFVVESILRNEDFQKLINDHEKKFDLILFECYHPVLYALAERFKAPIIGVSSFVASSALHDAFGNPNHPILYPDAFATVHKELSLMMKIRNMLYDMWFLFIFRCSFVPKSHTMARKYFGGDITYVGELEQRISLLFLNINPVMNTLRPMVPAILETGQMHLKPRKTLPDLTSNLQQFLDESRKGVVYFSLGSNIKSTDIDDGLQTTIAEALSELPYNVIWKWDVEAPSYISPNVLIKKWVPQQHLLAHPNIRAFVTQGGLQSIEEAIHNAVPLVGLPFIADQPMNVEKIVVLGAGVGLDPVTVTKEELKRSIVEVVENSSYKRKIEEVRSILFDSPMRGIQKAVWWSEYVIRHRGAKHLRSPSADISWFEYLMLDVVVLLLIFVLVIAYGSSKVVQFGSSRCRSTFWRVF